MSNYYSIAEARAAGITEDQINDTVLELEIDYWEGFIEEITGRKFYSRSKSVTVDGNDTRLIKLDHRLAPLTAVSSLTVDDTVVDPDYYVVYQDIPAIAFTDKIYRNIYAGLTQTFPSDKQNVTVVGTFGLASVPKAMKMLMRLIITKVANNQMDDKFKGEKIGDYSYANFDLDGGFSDPQLNMFLRALRTKVDISIV